MNLRSPLVLTGLLCLVIALGCAQITNPAGYQFGEAERLATEGKYAEAIKVYELIAKTYPDSPEAKKVPAAIDATVLRKAKAQLDAGAFIEAGKTYEWYFAKDPMEAVASEPALGACTWYARGTVDPNKPGLALMLAYAAESHAPALTAEIKAWTCSNRTRFREWAECSTPDPIPGTDFAAARKRVAEGREACSQIVPLGTLCGPEAAAEVDALINTGPVPTLERNLIAAAAPEVQQNLATFRDLVAGLARSCDKTKAEVKSLVRQMGASDPGDVWVNPFSYPSVSTPVANVKEQQVAAFDKVGGLLTLWHDQGVIDGDCENALRDARRDALDACMKSAAPQDAARFRTAGAESCMVHDPPPIVAAK